ncbi:MAG: hypothetical protein K0S55_885 [Clostridia bacterium]|nr:hypothetical protein [Clostridia bacterium]
MQWYNKEITEVLKDLNVESYKGLSNNEAEIRLKKYGLNKLEEKKQKPIWKKLLEQFSDFMVIILLLAAVISYITSVMQGNSDILDPIIILIIVLINAIMGVIQENKAEKAIEALQKLSAPTVKVIRESNQNTIKSEVVVPGDIVVLEAGDFVPADARLIEAINLKTEESALTGESVPVEKDHKAVFSGEITLGDRKNMILSSSIITSGRATAVIVETGMATQVGHIAKMINTNETPQTPLQKRLEETGKILGIAALLICAGIFVMGIIQQTNPLDMFLISVSLAVAAIPEGLPAIVTIVLAMGVQRMVKNNAIIRKLPAVETLGSATIICSDKTGTLTQNKMTVTEIASLNDNINLNTPFGIKLLSLCTLCNNSIITTEKGIYTVKGDPTETAFVNALLKLGKNKLELEKENPRFKEIPFDSERKLMTTIHRLNNGRYRIVTKGAPEVLLKHCSFYEKNDNIIKMNTVTNDHILALNESMSKKALRVLGAAYKDTDNLPLATDSASIENNLIFCGLVGMIDPPRPEVKRAVSICRRAGIKPVMITGDHIITAMAIAKELGILKGSDKVATGEDLNRMSQQELDKNINQYSVFARVTPEHKVKIVKAFQANKHVVAMTGDGVNDAPALKIADIGCAMGIQGTDVAKGAADMILTDDNFASIVEAVREGRGIYQNIRKAIHFLLSSNIGEILTIFTAFFLCMPTPLLPIQLLWVNLVTDSLPALALGVDTIDEDIMDRKPINPKKGLFSDGLATKIIIEGFMIGALALLSYTIGRSYFDISAAEPIIGRTMAFCVLSLSQLIHAFNTRSSYSLFHIGILSNKSLIAAFLICGFMQISVVSIAPLAAIFKVVPLTILQWEWVLGISLLPLILVEIVKLFTSKRKNKINNFSYEKM